MMKLFKKRTPLTPEAYQQHVLTLLRSEWPDMPFDPDPAEPLIIHSRREQFGLQNLYSSYTLHGLKDRERDKAVREHFGRMVRALAVEAELHELPWAKASSCVRLQLMPAEYRDSIPVVTFPFSDNVLVSVVLDLSNTYSYVRDSDLTTWGISAQALYAQALENLDAASTALEIHISGRPNAFVALETKDGYDAARLLVPGIRSIALERLGSPCLAGVPNRDFLFFWALDAPPDFHGFVRDKLSRDHAEQPYPLTAAVFRITELEISEESDA